MYSDKKETQVLLQDFETTEEEKDTFKTRAGQIMALAVPSTMSNMAGWMKEVINLAFIGHYGSKEMFDGVGLGNMTIQLLANSLLLGLNGALNTFISQARGAKEIE